ncbi:hypothetical protein EI94DRAFT_631500 [Lactarius quietus]|nr:hypothetical protein EI94DRAFT_631500 [Lactarius quietus]
MTPLLTPPKCYGSTEISFGTSASKMWASVLFLRSLRTMQARARPITSSSVRAVNDTLIVALSLSGYDYLVTVPSEYRFYRAFYRNKFRLTCQSCLNLQSWHTTDIKFV